MKKEVLLILSILFPAYYANANEENSIDDSKEKIEEIKESSLHEKLSEKGIVTTQEAAESGRTTGGGRTVKVGKEY